MASMFELFVDADSHFRFRLTAPDGTVMAVSKAFGDKPAAVAGITAVREYAGMGLITDLCPTSTKSSPAPLAPPRSGSATCQDQRISTAGHEVRTRPVPRTALGPLRAGAA